MNSMLSVVFFQDCPWSPRTLCLLDNFLQDFPGFPRAIYFLDTFFEDFPRFPWTMRGFFLKAFPGLFHDSYEPCQHSFHVAYASRTGSGQTSQAKARRVIQQECEEPSNIVLVAEDHARSSKACASQSIFILAGRGWNMGKQSGTSHLQNLTSFHFHSAHVWDMCHTPTTPFFVKLTFTCTGNTQKY